MNLVDLRGRLKAIDVALSEIQKCVSKAGSELVKANAGIGTIMGEGDGVNGRIARKRRVRKPKDVLEQTSRNKETTEQAAADGQGTAAASMAMQAEVGGHRSRGRPKGSMVMKEMENPGLTEAEA
jgi:hypothetical protein